MQGFRSFSIPEQAMEGIELVHMVWEGRVKSVDVRDAGGEAKFVESFFDVAP
jgi:hypothetical protein